MPLTPRQATRLPSGKWELKVEGIDQLNTLLQRALGRSTVEAASRRLKQMAEAIMTKSKELVPVDTSALKNSGVVMDPEVGSGKVTVTLGYGGPAAPYAIPVHEIPPPPAESVGGRSAVHQPPTTWKYLELPVLQAAASLEKQLGTALREELEGRVAGGARRTGGGK